MDPERWQQIKQLYNTALELEPGQRESFLQEACAGDQSLLKEIERLLAQQVEAEDLLGKPAFEVAAQALAQDHKDEPQPNYAGRSLLHYRITERIGEGGMGVVYRARDTHLDRTVAIKVLPGAVVADPERKRRFVQEAKAASALNHPNIIDIHDINSDAGVDFIVMENVPGNTLDRRIGGKGLRMGEVLKYAVQIADAIAAAHAAGIVHRDLKPANIMVTETGLIKVLDFGLAKLTQPLENEVSATASAMESLTGEGRIMGTVAYMSPEQAEGKAVDARSDIFSFGSVLYEMISGKQAFQGDSTLSTLSAILNKEVAPLSADIPHDLEKIVTRCLRKDPARRFQAMADLKVELEELKEAVDLRAELKRLKRDSDSSNPAVYEEPTSRVARSWRVSYPIAAAVLLLLAIAVGTTWWIMRSRMATGQPQLRRLTWDTGLTTDPALSADGRWLAYASDRSGEGNLDIWVQQLAKGETRGEPVRITRDPADDSEPNLSPDGSQIVFTSARDGGGIYLVSTTGGQERLLVKEGHRPRFAPDGRSVAYWMGGASWWHSPKSFILPLSGGTSRQLQPTFRAVAFPTWSPDGNHLLFYGWKQQVMEGDIGEDAGWWVTSPKGGTAVQTGLGQNPQDNIRSLALPEWITQSVVIFPRTWQDNVDIWQVQISPKTFKVEGAPERITSGTNLQIRPTFASGYLAFTGLAVSGNICALPVDHIHGKALGEIQRLTQDTSVNGQPCISVDGTKLVYTSERSAGRNGWIKDLRSGRVTAILPELREGQRLHIPRISGDGSKVAYIAYTGSKVGLFVADTNDLVARLLCEDCGSPGAWFPDGRRLLLYFLPGGYTRIEALDIDSGERTLVVQYSLNLIQPHFSPDGRWLALHTHYSAAGRQILIIPLRNGVAAKEQEWVTVTDGSSFDLDKDWSPDGNLLYFFSERDGFRCIWAQRLEPSSKLPTGPAFPIYHSHEPSRSIKNIIPGYLTMAVSGNQIVFPMGELTGNIYITELRHR